METQDTRRPENVRAHGLNTRFTKDNASPLSGRHSIGMKTNCNTCPPISGFQPTVMKTNVCATQDDGESQLDDQSGCKFRKKQRNHSVPGIVAVTEHTNIQPQGSEHDRLLQMCLWPGIRETCQRILESLIPVDSRMYRKLVTQVEQPQTPARSCSVPDTDKGTKNQAHASGTRLG